jgi:hypothetical protein
MANGFKHASQGSVLTQTEYEAEDTHVLDSQATGDVIYASSSTVLQRLAVGSTGAVLTVTGGVPAWDTTWTPSGNLIPAADDSYDLGSAAAAWQDLFLEGDISLTDAGSISTAAGALTIGSAAAINITPTAGSAILLDGTISIDAGVVTGATSITSTAFAGALTGNVTGNASGTAATVTTAAQGNITSLGTLTALTVSGLITANGGITFADGDDIAFTGATGTNDIVLTNGLADALSITDGSADVITVSTAGATNTVAITGDLTVSGTIAADTATVATTVTITDNESTAEANPIIFAAGAAGAGNIGLESDGDLTYNPSSGTLTAATFVGALTGNADTVTTNASLTGMVTSSGNTASLGAFTKAELTGAVSDGTPLYAGDITVGASAGFVLAIAIAL